MPASGTNDSIEGEPSLNITASGYDDLPSIFDLSHRLHEYFVHQKDFQLAVLAPIEDRLRRAYQLIKQTREVGNLGDDEKEVFKELLLEVVSTWILMLCLLDENLKPLFTNAWAEKQGLGDKKVGKTYCGEMYGMVEENHELNHFARVLCWLQLELRKELYLEELKKEKPLFIKKSTPQQLHLSQDSLESTMKASFTQGGVKRARLNEYNQEEVFYHCGRYTTAGFFSSTEKLLLASQQSHLICPLFSNSIPHLNLLFKDGQDFYQHCLPPLRPPSMTPKTSESGLLNVRRIANILDSNEYSESKYRVQDCGQKVDDQCGFGTQSSTLNWSCMVKAKSADKRGLCHEYAFYSLMSGKKQKSEALFTRSWSSQLYSHFYFHLRHELDHELHKQTTPHEDLMDLQKALRSPSSLEIYIQGKDIQSKSGWSWIQREAGDDHEQALIQALSLHRPQTPIQEFFRTLQSALILKKYKSLLTEFACKLRHLMSTLKTSRPSTVGEWTRQMWFVCFLDIFMLLVNTNQLKKLELSNAQLSLLDEMLACVLEMLYTQGDFVLIPMYACHLKISAQVEWYKRIMRSTPWLHQKAEDWFSEAKYWLEEWHGFEKEGFHRNDDHDAYEVSMIELVYDNAKQVCKDLTKGLKDRELALFWLGIALEKETEDSEILANARGLYFSLFLEVSFIHLPSAIKLHSFIPSTLTKHPAESQEVNDIEKVKGKDLEKWLEYCLLAGDTTLFLDIAENSGFQFNGWRSLHQSGFSTFLQKLTSTEHQNPMDYLNCGREIHQKLLNTVTSDLFFEELVLDPQVEKHKIEFVVCKELEQTKSFSPFTSEDMSSRTESIETFLNDIRACYENTVAACYPDSPLPGLLFIRMEFKKEALTLSPMLSLLTTFLKSSSMVISLFSAPLSILKRLANTQTKTALLADLMKVHRVVRYLEYGLERKTSIANLCTSLMERRCELIDEEQILNKEEILEFLKVDMNLKIDQYIEFRDTGIEGHI